MNEGYGQAVSNSHALGASLGAAVAASKGNAVVTLEMIEQVSVGNAQKLATLLERLSGIHGTLTGDPSGVGEEDRPVAQGALFRLHDTAMTQSDLINRIESIIDSIQASLG